MIGVGVRFMHGINGTDRVAQPAHIAVQIFGVELIKVVLNRSSSSARTEFKGIGEPFGGEFIKGFGTCGGEDLAFAEPRFPERFDVRIFCFEPFGETFQRGRTGAGSLVRLIPEVPDCKSGGVFVTLHGAADKVFHRDGNFRAVEAGIALVAVINALFKQFLEEPEREIESESLHDFDSELVCCFQQNIVLAEVPDAFARFNFFPPDEGADDVEIVVADAAHVLFDFTDAVIGVEPVHGSEHERFAFVHSDSLFLAYSYAP